MGLEVTSLTVAAAADLTRSEDWLGLKMQRETATPVGFPVSGSRVRPAQFYK